MVRRMKTKICGAIMLFVASAAGLGWAKQYQYPFQDPKLPVEARTNNILSLMTAACFNASKYPWSGSPERRCHADRMGVVLGD